jgi:hypothetical protein
MAIFISVVLLALACVDRPWSVTRGAMGDDPDKTLKAQLPVAVFVTHNIDA